MQKFLIIKETLGDKVYYQLKKGNSTLLTFTENEWNNWIHTTYASLLIYSGNKSDIMYKESLSAYNFICNYFKIKTI